MFDSGVVSSTWLTASCSDPSSRVSSSSDSSPPLPPPKTWLIASNSFISAFHFYNRDFRHGILSTRRIGAAPEVPHSQQHQTRSGPVAIETRSTQVVQFFYQSVDSYRPNLTGLKRNGHVPGARLK